MANIVAAEQMLPWQLCIFQEYCSTVVGVSLSEPHTSEKFGTVVMYTNNYEKKQTISILGW